MHDHSEDLVLGTRRRVCPQAKSLLLSRELWEPRGVAQAPSRVGGCTENVPQAHLKRYDKRRAPQVWGCGLQDQAPAGSEEGTGAEKGRARLDLWEARPSSGIFENHREV